MQGQRSTAAAIVCRGATLKYTSSFGGPGVGARCGDGLFSTYKSPELYLSFTILVSLILVKYPDRIGPVNTVLAGTVLVGIHYTYFIRVFN